MLTNKTASARTATLLISGGEAYTQAQVCAIHGDSPEIRPLDGAAALRGGGVVTVELPAYCAAMVVLSTTNP
ncbi:MAG: hypothetical protein IJ343_15695 [Clostridia bacterium]|nr:hypothetical protein [Clostridia bacterium]